MSPPPGGRRPLARPAAHRTIGELRLRLPDISKLERTRHFYFALTKAGLERASSYHAGCGRSLAGDVLTDADGRFTVHGLAPGTYRVEFSDAQGSVPYQHPDPIELWRSLKVEIEGSSSMTHGDLVVRDAPLTLRGLVRDADGRPRAGKRVVATHDSIVRDPADEAGDRYGDGGAGHTYVLEIERDGRPMTRRLTIPAP